MKDEMINVLANIAVMVFVLTILYFFIFDGNIFYCVVTYLLSIITTNLNKIANKHGH